MEEISELPYRRAAERGIVRSRRDPNEKIMGYIATCSSALKRRRHAEITAGHAFGKFEHLAGRTQLPARRRLKSGEPPILIMILLVRKASPELRISRPTSRNDL
jgi:hypothetical protein